VTHEQPPEDNSVVRYFAYGANMSRAVLVGRRGLRPLSHERARLDGYRLVFDLPGLPVVEPAFASIEAHEGAAVHGVLYRLRASDLARVRTYESPRYRLIDVDVHGEDAGLVRARAFQNRAPVAGIVPSRRYLRLLREAARDAGLPEEYVARLEAQPSVYLPLVSEVVSAGERRYSLR
jgi:hypothetical protein